MNKRRRKKLSRDRCPVCKGCSGIWGWKKLRTGRWVSEFCECFDCNETLSAEKGKSSNRIYKQQQQQQQHTGVPSGLSAWLTVVAAFTDARGN